MRIGIVGGIERSEGSLRELAEGHGHQLDFHGGHLAGRGSLNLGELVRRVELVLILTDVNSHGAVQLARRLARQERVPVLLLRRCGPARFGQILRDLAVSAKADAVHA